jgi:hypothetical protein
MIPTNEIIVFPGTGPHFSSMVYVEAMSPLARQILKRVPVEGDIQIGYDSLTGYYHARFRANSHDIDVRYYKVFSYTIDGKPGWQGCPYYQQDAFVDSIREAVLDDGSAKERLPLADLWVMQQSIRNTKQIDPMVEFVATGGRWTKEELELHSKIHGRVAYPIYITRFPDGMKMIHDGHHRAVSTFLGERKFLGEGEYVVRDWTYESYSQIAFERNYVTPFDPRTEVRLNDFGGFKVEVMKRYQNTGPEATTRFINNHRHLFCEPRRIKTVVELAEAYERGSH